MRHTDFENFVEHTKDNKTSLIYGLQDIDQTEDKGLEVINIQVLSRPGHGYQAE